MTKASLDQITSLLSYQPETGQFAWLVDRGLARVGMRAGSDSNGYVIIRIDGRNYLAHRLAWLMTHSEWPDRQIDHKNGDRSDNRIANLRLCDYAQNQQNAKIRSDNKLGMTGVCYHKRAGRYAAEIWANKRRHRLGYFDTAEAAQAAYLEAKARLHDFQNVPRTAGE